MESSLKNKEFFPNELDLIYKGNSDSCFPDFHFHDYYEMYYCIGGAKQFLIEDNIYSMEPGDLFLVNGYEIHKPLRDPNGDYRRIIVIINPEKIKKINKNYSITLLSCFISRENGHNNKIKLNPQQQTQFLELTTKIHDLDKNAFAYQTLLEAYYIELLVLVNRWFRDNFLTVRENEGNGLNPTVKMIIDYLNDNFTNNVTLDMLVEKFHLNKQYMCQLFKTTTGTTIHKYLISRRLARAKILLHQGHNVTETSELCGFQNYTNFIKAFKNHFGVSPKQFLKKDN